MKAEKVLIVEDEILMARLLQVNPEKEGYTVIEPESSSEKAVYTARSEKPHRILMDINLLSEMDGLEAIEAILSFLKVPIVFKTRYDDCEYKKRALALNPADYLIKPVEFHQIKKIIQYIEAPDNQKNSMGSQMS